MVRSRLQWLKHLLYAMSALALLCCLTEAGLRVYDSMTGQITRGLLYDRGMICKSWSVHHTLKPSHTFFVRESDTGTRVRVVLNSFGTRGREPAVPKPPGVYRVLCLGDEATLAPQIAEGDTFCGQLQQLLQSQTQLSVEVINAGVPEYCPLLCFLQFKQHLIGLKPDLVILNFDMSDVGDDYQFRRHTVMDVTGTPIACAHPDLEAPRVRTPLSGQDVLLTPQWGKQLLRRLWSRHLVSETPRNIDSPQGRSLWLEDHPPDWSMYIEQSLTPIIGINELLRNDYGTLLVATVPAPWQTSAVASNGGTARAAAGIAKGAFFQSRRPFETVAEFCRVHRLPMCDASFAFLREEHPEQFYLNHHAAFSARGHALYAQELARFVIQNVPGLWRDSSSPPEHLPQARLIPP